MDERTGERKEVKRKEIESAIAENRRTMEFLSDVDSRLFTLTYADYLSLPATLLDAVRILRKLRREQTPESDGPLGT